MACKTIITIDRQYGSGGATIGKQLAKLLDIPFYDREILNIAADKCGMDADALSSVDEKASSSLLYSLVMGTSSTFHSNIGVNYDVPINDKLFIVQSEVIRELAGKGACVLLGHCADYVLREEKNTVTNNYISNLYVKRDKFSKPVDQYFAVNKAKDGKFYLVNDKNSVLYLQKAGTEARIEVTKDSGPIEIGYKDRLFFRDIDVSLAEESDAVIDDKYLGLIIRNAVFL